MVRIQVRFRANLKGISYSQKIDVAHKLPVYVVNFVTSQFLGQNVEMTYVSTVNIEYVLDQSINCIYILYKITTQTWEYKNPAGFH